MFFALPEFSTKEGRIVNATFGMAKFFVQQLVKEKPDYVIFIKDAKWENFRHTLYSEYKATRERMPDSLRSQMGDIEEMIARMHLKIIEIPGYEADDVIGTLATRLSEESSNEIYILSWDKDLYALVSEQVKVYDTQRKKISGPEETFEKFWVPANCVRDYLAICGDTSDNIPWISGIGPVKAQILLNHFWSLEKIYETIDALGQDSKIWDPLPLEVQKLLKGKTLEKFIDEKEIAFLSQKLATLACDMSLEDFDIEDFVFIPEDIKTPELFSFFEELEFFSLLESIPQKKQSWEMLWKKVYLVQEDGLLHDLETHIHLLEKIVLDTETTSLDVREAELVWISILLKEDEIYYINIGHFGKKVTHASLQNFINNILRSDIEIIGHNLKYDLQILEKFLEKDFSQTQVRKPEMFWQTQLWV